MVAQGSRRPPSVERVLSSARARLAGDVEPGTLTAIAREVIEEERQRLAGERAATTVDGLAETVVERLHACLLYTSDAADE